MQKLTRTTLMNAIAVTGALVLASGCGKTTTSAPVPAPVKRTPAPAPKPVTEAARPVSPTFRSLSQNIFALKCTKCHNARHASDKVDLSSHDAIMNGEHQIVIPGNAKGSHLWQAIDSGDMPYKEGKRLPQVQIQAVFDWIQAGAEDN